MILGILREDSDKKGKSQAIRWEVKFWRQLDLAVAGLMDGQMDPVLDFYHRLTRLIQDKDKLIEGKSKRKEFVSQGKEVEKEIPAALHSLEEELERLDQMIEYLLNASDEVPEDSSLSPKKGRLVSRFRNATALLLRGQIEVVKASNNSRKFAHVLKRLRDMIELAVEAIEKRPKLFLKCEDIKPFIDSQFLLYLLKAALYQLVEGQKKRTRDFRESQGRGR